MLDHKKYLLQTVFPAERPESEFGRDINFLWDRIYHFSWNTIKWSKVLASLFFGCSQAPGITSVTQRPCKIAKHTTSETGWPLKCFTLLLIAILYSLEWFQLHVVSQGLSARRRKTSGFFNSLAADFWIRTWCWGSVTPRKKCYESSTVWEWLELYLPNNWAPPHLDGIRWSSCKLSGKNSYCFHLMQYQIFFLIIDSNRSSSINVFPSWFLSANHSKLEFSLFVPGQIWRKGLTIQNHVLKMIQSSIAS